MMKKTVIAFSVLAAAVLASCSSYQMPPFATQSRWLLQGNTVSSDARDISVDYGTFALLSNMSNSGYDLNFITSDNGFQSYDPYCRRYVADVLRNIPVAIDSMEYVLADQFLAFTPSATAQWMPQYVRNLDDGSELVVEANPMDHNSLREGELWRNVLFSDKQRRLVVVDRFMKAGRLIALAYVLQSERKGLPFSSVFHYNVANRDNVQPVGEHLRALLGVSLGAQAMHSMAHGYNNYIHRADSCFMAADYCGAVREFLMAFVYSNAPAGSHLYNAACAATLCGNSDLAFTFLDTRLAQEPDWYLDAPGDDSDLASLHGDPRWTVFCDTIARRRDRIEAGYDHALRARLQEIGGSDQDVRRRFLAAYRAMPRDEEQIASLLREMQRTDSLNQAAICEILDTRGFVGSDLVGNACTVFWLVIQHAPLELQRKYFPLFEEASERGDLSPETVAMMDDRIASFEGRPQRYGSQIVDGKLYPLLDPGRVDEWRTQKGMCPLAEYLRQMGVGVASGEDK